MAYKMKLVIKLSDGRVLSGTYPYLAAIARQESALEMPQCLSAELSEAN